MASSPHGSLGSQLLENRHALPESLRPKGTRSRPKENRTAKTAKVAQAVPSGKSVRQQPRQQPTRAGTTWSRDRVQIVIPAGGNLLENGKGFETFAPIGQKDSTIRITVRGDFEGIDRSTDTTVVGLVEIVPTKGGRRAEIRVTVPKKPKQAKGTLVINRVVPETPTAGWCYSRKVGAGLIEFVMP